MRARPTVLVVSVGGSPVTNTLCDGHHKAHHRGQLLLSGRAPDVEARWVAEVPHVRDAETVELARSAMRNLGCTRAEADRAVERALVAVGDGDVEQLVRAALHELR